MKSDIPLFADTIEEFFNVYMIDYGIKPLHLASILGYFWQCGLEITNISLESKQSADKILLIKNYY